MIYEPKYISLIKNTVQNFASPQYVDIIVIYDCFVSFSSNTEPHEWLYLPFLSLFLYTTSYLIGWIIIAWLRHRMETQSTSLVLCAWNLPVAIRSRRTVTRSFDVFIYLRLNKRLRNQWRCRWLETSSRSSWRHCNDAVFLWLCRQFWSRPHYYSFERIHISNAYKFRYPIMSRLSARNSTIEWCL